LHPLHEISVEAMGQLMAYNWPGNIRELENSIEAAVALSTDDILQVGDLPAKLQDIAVRPTRENKELLRINEIERDAILRALDETGDDKLEAARILGIAKTTIYRKIKEYAKTSKSA